MRKRRLAAAIMAAVMSMTLVMQTAAQEVGFTQSVTEETFAAVEETAEVLADDVTVDVSETEEETSEEESSEAETTAVTEAETGVTIAEAATEEITTEAVTEEITTEAATEEITTEAATEEITTEAVTEEITTEAATEEITTEAATEATQSGDGRVQRPSAPAALHVSASGMSVVLNWTASAGATSYQVLRSDTNNTNYNYRVNVGNVTRYVDRTTVGGRTYRYTIRALNSAGSSSNAPGKSICVTAIKPQAPTNLSASMTGSHVRLTWTASQGAGGYVVLRSDNNNTTYNNRFVLSNVTSFVDTTVTPGRTYRYTVRAVNPAGYSSNAMGKSITVMTLPTNLRAAVSGNLTNFAVTLTWNGSAGATGYYVMRSDNNNTSYNHKINVGNNTTYRDTDLEYGRTYRYTVRAYNAGGESTNAAGISVFVNLGPAAPASVTLEELPTGGVRISWPDTSADGYYVLRSDNNNTTYNRRFQVGNVNEYVDNAVECGRTYRYTVRGYNEYGMGPNAPGKSITIRNKVLTLNTEITDTLEAGGENLYVFTASQAGMYIFRSMGDLDTTACLYSDSNCSNLLAENDDGDGRNFKIEISLSANQTVYLCVKFFSSNTEGSYRLKVTQNESLQLNTEITDSLGAGEEKVYMFTAPQAATYVFESLGNLDTRGYLYSDSICSSYLADDDDEGEGLNFRITIDLSEDQTVYLRVRFFSNNLSGSYRLKVTGITNEIPEPESPEGTPPGNGTYRALLIGQSDYGGANDLSGPPYDVAAVAAVLRRSGYTVNTSLNENEARIRSRIQSAFGSATDNDVSLFYYSGHGVTSTGSYSGALALGSGDYIQMTELAAMLSPIRGTIIVILDSCGSGAAITRDKDGSMDFNPTAFNASAIEAFKAVDNQARYGELMQSRFKVITGSAAHQSSYEGTYNGQRGGYVTMGVLKSIGYNYGGTWDTTLNGDSNGDRKISVKEAYQYAYNFVYNRVGNRQNVQVYPANDNTVFLAR